MPLYDLQCIRCGTVEEKLFTRFVDFLSQDQMKIKWKEDHQAFIDEANKKWKDYELIDTFPTFKQWMKSETPQVQTCDCGGFQELVAPLCAMQPDHMWAGTDTRFGHFTSKSKYEQTLKDRNIVSVDKKELDKVRKNVYNAKQDIKRKQLNNLNTFIEKELASVEISPDGNTVKDRNKYARKRQ